MVRKAKELVALEVKRLTKPGRHPVGGVAGLYLAVNEGNGSSWVLRITFQGKREVMGLGPYPEVGLAAARDKAREMKALFDKGINPKVQRRELESERRAKQAMLKTFEEAARAYITANEDGWENAKHRGQWISTLETYVFPFIGNLMVQDVTQEGVMSVLEPIWKTKNETAKRVRSRIKVILDWCKVRNYRSGDNPAEWKGRLDQLLLAPSKVAKVEHHKALPYSQMPEFMAQLRKRPGVAAQALEFAILCAARSGEVRGATWSEIDLNASVWTVPAERMKARKEHLVPLSHAALKLLKAQQKVEGTDLVFPSSTLKPLSDMSLLAVVRRMEIDAVPHGFRSTFRDWVGDSTKHPGELAELALAHVLANKVEAAYRRGDALEKRRVMMEDWSKFCSAVDMNPYPDWAKPGKPGFGRWK